MSNQFSRCFVIMPFSSEFDNVRLPIEAALDHHKIEMKTNDDSFFTNQIIDNIYKGIEKADLVIADISVVAEDRFEKGKYHSNSNVLYELGFACGMRKTVILISRSVDKTAFDLSGYLQIKYNKDNLKSLKNELKSAIRDLEERILHIICFVDEDFKNDLSNITNDYSYKFVFEDYNKAIPIVQSGSISNYSCPAMLYCCPEHHPSKDTRFKQLIEELNNKGCSLPVAVFTKEGCTCSDNSVIGKYQYAKSLSTPLAVREWLDALQVL